MAARETFKVTIDENGSESVLIAKPIWADTIAAEKHLRDNGLGKMEENTITALTVMTYSALKRSNALPAGTTYEAFEGVVVAIEVDGQEEAPKSE